jgi:hypothetical protein
MLFRPEEVHTHSPVRPTFRRPAKSAIGVANYCLGLNRKDRLITQLHHDRLRAIEAGSVHTYHLSGK